jgi:autotransporter-associated beta strand protein
VTFSALDWKPTSAFSSPYVNADGSIVNPLRWMPASFLAGGGTLQVGNGGSTGSIASSSSVVNNGELKLNMGSGASTTVNAVISGTGKVSQTGVGTGVLTADNTYSGTTTVSSGTLNVGDGGNSGTLGTGAVTNNAILNIDRSATTSAHRQNGWSLDDRP